MPLLETPGSEPAGFTPIVERVENAEEASVLSVLPVQGAGSTVDLRTALQSQFGRGERWALASLPTLYAGDVHVPFLADGEEGRRVVRYRDELGLFDPFYEGEAKAWFTIELPLIVAPAGGLRLFRLAPRWRLANEFTGDALEGTQLPVPYLPRVDTADGRAQILERLDQWEEVLPGPLGTGTGPRFEVTGDSVRIVTDRLGVFLLVEVLP